MTSRKLHKVTRLCLFLTLLNATTPVFADDEINYGPDDVELNYGHQAPFDGVLTTPLRYVEYTNAVDQRDYLSKRLEEELTKQVSPPINLERDALLVTGGVIAGFIVYALTSSKFQK